MYREKDIEIVNNNLSSLEDKAREKFLTTFEPTLDEFKKVYNIIKDYIRDNNLIVYGGYAQNALIKKLDSKETFYKEIDLADIEFYSYEPLKDLINLCDLLTKKGFKYVEGKEGVHNETYKIFVNFHNYLDLSYMPKNIFMNFPTINAEGMKITHPNTMLIDAYRIYTDPMTSWRILSKTFSRFNKLMSFYPFNENLIYNNISFSVRLNEKDYDKIMKLIRKRIIHNSKLIMVGFHPFNRLMKKANMPNNFYVHEPYYQLITDNLNNDSKKILNILNSKFSNIKMNRYYKYFQYFDETVEYFYKDQLILRLYGNNEKCIVYKYSPKKKTNYGTFQLQILFLLIHNFIGIIRKNKFTETFNMTMILRLLKARDTFLEKNNMNVLDNSPFQEFTIDCIGDTKDLLRASLLEGLNRKKQGKQMKFSYRSSQNGKPGKIPNYIFDNSSGEIKRN